MSKMMFKLSNKKDGLLTIYKNAIIDAGTCIGKGNDDDVGKAAIADLQNMFAAMCEKFANNGLVRLNYLKSKDSDFLDFKNINDFKVWLVRNQNAKSYSSVLNCLRVFCKKREIDLPSISIVFGDYLQDTIYNTDMYFNNTYDREWLKDEQIRAFIRDIDKSEVYGDEAIKSPVFGIMPVEKLSGGVKTLMLIYKNPDMIFNASTCGDNCAKWIKKISKEKSFVINLYHAMVFPNDKIDAYILNGGEIIHSMEELYLCADKYCRS